MDEVVCLCPSCRAKFIQGVEGSLKEGVELEGGISHPIEEFEELRLILKSILRQEVLNSLLGLYKELSKEPRQMEMFAWFVRNSQFGGECRYAQAALKKFKETRLDRLEDLLHRCLTAIKELRN